MRKLKLSKKAVIVSGAAFILFILALCTWAPWRASTANNSVTPNFQAILPRNTSIANLGGWQKLTPPDGTPVYVYTDSIDGVGISVSQQPLPASLKDSTGAKVAEVAKGYSATKSMYADTTKVYIGTNAEGPQSVIFSKNNLLILIKSRAVIKDDSWTTYIHSLE